MSGHLLGLPGAAFGRVLAARNLWASSWTVIGQLLGGSGTVLAASWAALRLSWVQVAPSWGVLAVFLV